MSIQSECSNRFKESCPCTADCENHGRCCECVAHHKDYGGLPACLRK